MSVDFLDSNVFIYLFDETDDQKRATAEQLIHEALAGGQSLISYQVVQETLNVLTRKLAAPLTPDDAQRFLDHVLAPMWRVDPSPALYTSALHVQTRYRFGFYDSLVVAAALEAGCDRLLTEDLQDGQQIDGLTIANPFRS